MNIAIIGPAHPLRGGLATYNARLAEVLQAQGHSVTIYSFSLQYPGFLFPGTSQFTDEPAPEGIRIETLINSVNPFNWLKAGQRIKKARPDLVIVRYWLPFMGPCLGTILRIVRGNKHSRIVCIADNVIPHEKRPGDKAFTKYFLKPVDAFITMSKDVLKDLQTLTDKPARFTVHPVYDNFEPPVRKEEACKKLPVITFDRAVNTACPVTAVKSVGGYAWGKAGAEYIATNIPKGGKVLVLRTAPGIEVFETRWEAAKRVFATAGIVPVGNEFVGGDRAKTKAVVNDYLSRVGKIDAVWVDLGAVSVAVVEAFEDAGAAFPIITGEDQQDYLRAWKKHGFKGIAPTYPAYQWRTAVIAAIKVLKGEPVPGPVWTLPQPVITGRDLSKYVNTKLSPLHYSMCGCEDMPGFPERWGGKQ